MNPKAFILTDRVAIITGSGRGLGAATARALAKAGAKVCINDVNAENAGACAAEITQAGGQALTSHHDISKTDQAEALVAMVEKQWGRVDILVNNAGVLRDGMLVKLTEADWDTVINVNLKGTFNMGQACAKRMKTQNYGKILNLASVAWHGNIGQSNYSASKAGVVGLTRTWALELAKNSINVNAIAPGLIDTDMIKSIPQEIRDAFIKRIPLKRLGQPDDIAQLIHFLVSDASSYITGQVIDIDGGLTVGW